MGPSSLVMFTAICRISARWVSSEFQCAIGHSTVGVNALVEFDASDKGVCAMANEVIAEEILSFDIPDEVLERAASAE
jgi:hypothetical protein